MNPIISHGLSMLSDMTELHSNKKDEILERWKLSKSMPRKKKKLERKNIELDWQINKYLGGFLNI